MFRKITKKTTVFYYVLIVVSLLFLFFSNDFGLIDIRKTGLVLAVGIDREDDDFVLTTQIASPTSDGQNGTVKALQIETRGKTVADAYNLIGAETGWYPKLVFCNLIVLGNSVTERNVFDALGFFLRNEYMSDACNLVTCESSAREILDVTTPTDEIGSLAILQVLSENSSTTGTVAPVSMREFALDYYGDSKSGFMPVLTTLPTQSAPPEKNSDAESGNGNSGSEAKRSGTEKSGETGNTVFSARQTALFYAGKRVGTLTEEETFAFLAVTGKLRLALSSVDSDGATYTLKVQKNRPDIRFEVDENGSAKLNVSVRLSCNTRDTDLPQTVAELATLNKVPDSVFRRAERDFSDCIESLFEKSRFTNCDVLRVTDKLKKHESSFFNAYKKDILKRIVLSVNVQIEPIQ